MDTQKNFGSPSTFVFSQPFDSQYLTGLYDNDYVWVEDIFNTVLNTYSGDVGAIQQHLSENNLENLRKAVHKMKPSFGFIGMMVLQEKCQKLEDRCKNAGSVSEVEEETKELITEIQNSKSVIEKECDRLKAFNLSRS